MYIYSLVGNGELTNTYLSHIARFNAHQFASMYNEAVDYITANNLPITYVQEYLIRNKGFNYLSAVVTVVNKNLVTKRIDGSTVHSNFISLE